jgi:hypothetical protein
MMAHCTGGRTARSSYRGRVRQVAEQIDHRLQHRSTAIGRSHRIDADEFYRHLEGIIINGTALFNDSCGHFQLGCNG